MHCLQVYLPSEVSYIGFGVFSMHPPVVLASLFFFFPELFFFLSSTKGLDLFKRSNQGSEKSIEDDL